MALHEFPSREQALAYRALLKAVRTNPPATDEQYQQYRQERERVLSGGVLGLREKWDRLVRAGMCNPNPIMPASMIESRKHMERVVRALDATEERLTVIPRREWLSALCVQDAPDEFSDEQPQGYEVPTRMSSQHIEIDDPVPVPTAEVDGCRYVLMPDGHIREVIGREVGPYDEQDEIAAEHGIRKYVHHKHGVVVSE